MFLHKYTFYAFIYTVYVSYLIYTLLGGMTMDRQGTRYGNLIDLDLQHKNNFLFLSHKS